MDRGAEPNDLAYDACHSSGEINPDTALTGGPFRVPGIRRAQSSEARIRHGLPESPAPCPEAVFGRVHAGRMPGAQTAPSAPTWLQIAQAIKPGCKRAHGQRAYLRAVIADPVIAALRADARRAVLELARVLARHADWRTMTAWRPRDLACDEIGSSRDPSKPLSISAYKRARQVLEEQGFLGLAAAAWTPMLRAGALAEGGGTSPVFVLCVPRREPLPGHGEITRVNGPLAGSRSEPGKAPRAREARAEVKDEDPEVKGEKARAPRGQSVLPPSGVSPLGAVPQNCTEALGAARAMQERTRLLRRISGEHLRHLARPFFAAGWSPRDVLHAIDHSPAGRQHGYTSGVRSVPGWVRARLTEWLGPDEVPLPSRSQRLADARRQVLAEQAARRARAAAGRASAADYPAQAARAREMLARRPRPQAAMAVTLVT